VKEDYRVEVITKSECAPILESYHYLTGISRGFKSGVNYGLIHNKKVVGVCIFTGFPVPELVKGCFGLNRDEQYGMFELSRLCLEPSHQEIEHNLASWFVARCIKRLRGSQSVRAILSYADSQYHEGVVYRALGFDYYGMTSAKKDFYIKTDNGFVKHSRGKTKGVDGEWRPRTRKHRFLKVFDKSLSVKWKCDEQQ